MTSAILSAVVLCVAATCAQAQIMNKYDITPQEQAACQADATALCSSTYPDQDALLACMRANVAQLSPACRTSFIAGLHRRRL